MSDFAFVIMHVGPEGSEIRRRADEITEYIIGPTLADAEFELLVVRSDQDATPGAISPKMLRDLVEARVVIADLTGRNPNVYYELGVAHSFRKSVISLGQASGLPFDLQDERIIPLPDLNDKLGVRDAETAKAKLVDALRIVLSPNYEPASPLSSIATRQALSDLASENPVAAEISALRDAVDDVRNSLSVQLDVIQAEVDRRTLAQDRDKRMEEMIRDGSFTQMITDAIGSNPEAFRENFLKVMPSPPPSFTAMTSQGGSNLLASLLNGAIADQSFVEIVDDGEPLAPEPPASGDEPEAPPTASDAHS